MSDDIKDPTIRKVRNRNMRPIRYRTEDDVRHGWIVEETDKYVRVRFPGEDRSRKLPLSEWRFITELTPAHFRAADAERDRIAEEYQEKLAQRAAS